MAKFEPPEVVEPEIPRIFYDGMQQAYWIEDSGGNWMKINETSVKRELKAGGFDPTSKHGANSECDMAFMRIQKEQSIYYAGGLAGYDRGPTLMNGRRVLVTSSPDIIVPQSGSWPLIESIVHRMFRDDDVYFYGWAKMTYECLYLRAHKPGQILALVGPTGCGKSFLQSVLIHYLLGGRSGSPYRYMSGETTFNNDFFATEHLLIGDEVSGTDIRTRLHFGKELKKIAAERNHSCHKKGADAVTMTPFWRCTVSLNPDGTNIMVLPPLGTSMIDKIMMLKVYPGPMPMPTTTAAEEENFREAILAELPAFCQWLLDIEIPDTLSDPRYGIRAAQNQELLELLDEHSPDEKLWDIIVHVLAMQKVKTWEGATADLEELLTTASDAAKKLFTYSSACGMYMARLAEKQDGRVTRPRSRGYWEINVEAQNHE